MGGGRQKGSETDPALKTGKCPWAENKRSKNAELFLKVPEGSKLSRTEMLTLTCLSILTNRVEPSRKLLALYA